MGWAPSAEATKAKAKFVYLLNADDFDPSTIPKDAFVVYQGHHGDLGAQYADVCLPGSAYTEKSSTWVNTEGRVQRGREAVNAPGAARDDWKIVRALSEAVAVAKRDDHLVLPYDDIPGLRERMWTVSPTLVRLDAVDRVSLEANLAGMKLMADGTYAAGAAKAGAKKPFGKTIENFYRTDPISRACVVRARSPWR
jgi:NADH dehydrogenase (ubiquinone) Fe-S protein 1